MKRLPPSTPELMAGWKANSELLPYMSGAGAIMRAYHILLKAQEAVLAPLELTMSRYAVLSALERSDDRSLGISSLSRLTFVHPATLTYVLDGLEDRGLVTRRTDRTDRRAVIAEITSAGRKLVRRAESALGKIQFGLCDLSPEEAAQLAPLLDRVGPVLTTLDVGTGPVSRGRSTKGRPGLRRATPGGADSDDASPVSREAI